MVTPKSNEPQEPDNEFERGYDAAYSEIYQTLLLWEEHNFDCHDCPPCEVIRTVIRKLVARAEDVDIGKEYVLVDFWIHPN